MFCVKSWFLTVWSRSVSINSKLRDKRRQIVAFDTRLTTFRESRRWNSQWLGRSTSVLQKLTETKELKCIFFLTQRVWGETLFQWALLLVEMLFRGAGYATTDSLPSSYDGVKGTDWQSLAQEPTHWHIAIGSASWTLEFGLSFPVSGNSGSTILHFTMDLTEHIQQFEGIVHTSSLCSTVPVDSRRFAYLLDKLHDLVISYVCRRPVPPIP